MRTICYLAICLSFYFGLSTSLDCKSFDSREIRLVTFDVFAAMMDTESSLVNSVYSLLSKALGVSFSVSQDIAYEWLESYGNYAGHVFTVNATNGEQPFLWLIKTNLPTILHKYNVNVSTSSQLFQNLIDAWGVLTPWPQTQNSILRVASARPDIAFATLSNGNVNTLRHAVSSLPNVPFSSFFSSDWPVGAFKPNIAMYLQLLKSGLSPNQILHVAGADIDGRGARDAGFFSALVYSDPVPGNQPCFLLKNITDLPRLFL